MIPSLPEIRPKGTAETRVTALEGRVPLPGVALLGGGSRLVDLAETWSALDRELSDLAFQIDSRGQGGLTLRLARLRNRMTELLGRP